MMPIPAKNSLRRTGEPVRVLLIGPGSTTRGGIAQFNVELARRLLDAGTQATVVAYRKVYPAFSRAGRQGPDPSARRHDVQSASILVPWFPWTWIRAASALSQPQPDVVVIQWWHPITALSTWYLGRRAKQLGVTVVLVCHNASPHEGFPLARRLTRLALRNADLLVALSAAVATELQVLQPRASVSVIPHPPYSVLTAEIDASRVEAWRVRIDAPREAKIVLFFGNVRPYKGLRDLLDAFPKATASTDAVLVVAGTFFESIDSYRARARELGIEESVRLFDEYIPNEDVAALFDVSDLVVLPYRSASQSGVIPLAATYRKPVVTTDVGGLREALGTTGTIVPPNDPYALGAAISEALELPPEPPPVDHGLWRRWLDAVLFS